MKRGFVGWKLSLLPKQALEDRRRKFVQYIRDMGLDCAVIYGDVVSADELQYLTNFAPYWSDGAAVITKEGKLLIITGLSARVNPWVMQITGIEEENIIAAGPKLSAKISEVMQKLVPVKGKVGLVGTCTPNKLIKALSEGDFQLTFLNSAKEELLVQRDHAYRDIILEGATLLNDSIRDVFDRAAKTPMTRKEVAVEIEHQCRMNGAMDFFCLTAGKDLVFNQLEDINEPGPWTIYIQMQYLGEWLVIGRTLGAEKNLPELVKTRDYIAQQLKPGKLDLCCDNKEIDVLIKPIVASDHLSSMIKRTHELHVGQVISVAVIQREEGLYLEDVYIITDKEALLMTTV